MTRLDDAAALVRSAADLAAATDLTFEAALRSVTETAAALAAEDSDRMRFATVDSDVYVPPRNVYEALVNVACEVGPVRKDRTADAGKGGSYQFRGIDGVMNAVHASMARNGVLPVPHDDPNPGGDGPQVREVELSSRNSNPWRHHTITTRWVVLGPGGTSLEVPIVSEALDNQDKGLGKARSYGMKDLLIRLLTLPTDDPAADNEAASIPPADRSSSGRGRSQQSRSRRSRQAPPPADPDADAVAAGFESEEHRRSCHNEVWALRRQIPDPYRQEVRDAHSRWDLRWPLTATELVEFRELVEGVLAAADADPTVTGVAPDGLPAAPEFDVDAEGAS